MFNICCKESNTVLTNMFAVVRIKEFRFTEITVLYDVDVFQSGSVFIDEDVDLFPTNTLFQQRTRLRDRSFSIGIQDPEIRSSQRKNLR